MADKMKRNRKFPLILLSLALLVVVGVNKNVYCQDNSYSLIVQQSPADGGTVSPDLGIHRISIDESVTLNATPLPGYRFVYWMGDVSSISSSRTEVLINAPKIVVAVFEKISNDQNVQFGGGGGGNVSNVSSGGDSKDTYTPGNGGAVGSLTPSVVERGSGGSVRISPKASRKLPPTKAGNSHEDGEVLDEEMSTENTGENGSIDTSAGLIMTSVDLSGHDDFVIQFEGPTAPEPATILLLGGGALLLRRRSK